MFTGTMLYRAERGEFGKVKAAVIAAMVFALAIAAGVWHSMMWHMNAADQRQFDLQWISCLVLAGGDVRHRVWCSGTGRFPACWPGWAWSATRSTCCTRSC